MLLFSKALHKAFESPNCPKIFFLSSAYATIGGEQVVTQFQME